MDFFKSGLITARLKSGGTTDLVRDAFMIVVISGTSSDEHCFSSHVGIGSSYTFNTWVEHFTSPAPGKGNQWLSLLCSPCINATINARLHQFILYPCQALTLAMCPLGRMPF